MSDVENQMNYTRKWLYATLVLIATLGCSDTARADANLTLVASPTVLTFSTPTGGVPAAQALAIASTTGSPFPVSAPITVTCTTFSGNWLLISELSTSCYGGASSTTPVNLIVGVNSAGLPAGVYGGYITISSPQAVNTLTVQVNLFVGTTSQLATNPSSLTFATQVGATPPVQQLTVIYPGTPTGFATTAGTVTGANWLQVSPVSGNPGDPVTVSINPTGLAAGTYTGQVTVGSTAPGIAPAIVGVTLLVSQNPALTISPSGNLTFFFQTGTAAPAPQALTFSSTGASLAFNINPTTTPVGNWLAVSRTDSTTPATVNVSVSPQGLLPGTYDGTLTVSSQGAANPVQTIGVRLVVSGTPLLVVSPTILNFTAQVGGDVPTPQTFQVTSTGGPLSFAVTVTSGNNWLSVGPVNGPTPQSISVGVNPTGLTAGPYTGTLTINSPTAPNGPQVVTVTLLVTSATQITALPAALVFNYQTTQPVPQAQQVRLSTAFAAVNFSVTTSVTSCNGPWLTVTPTSGTTTSTISVSVNPAGLPVGTCMGTVSVASGTAGNTPLNIPVTLNISNTPLLNISPVTIRLTAQGPSLPTGNLNISITSTDPNTVLNYALSVSTNSGSNWLVVSPPPGTTPSNLSVSADTSSLAPGTYIGAITIMSASLLAPQVVSVVLTITSSVLVTVTPSQLTFTQPSGGPAPAAQTLTLSQGQATLTFTASATADGGNWLTITPTSGTTPAALTVKVNGNTLTPGIYGGSVKLTFPGASNSVVTVPVILAVTPPSTLAVDKNSLSFTYVAGAANNPPAQTLSVTSSGPAPFNVATTTDNGGSSWLAATPASGTTPLNVYVAVNAVGLSVGTYTGTVFIALTGSANTPVAVKVTLTVTSPNVPAPMSILNGASNQAGPISPGEIIAIKGSLLGPVNGVSFTINAAGGLDNILGGTQVLFDSIPAAMTYSSSVQVNCVVPFSIRGRVSVQMVVTYQGLSSAPIALQVVEAMPGIFTPTGIGTGQGSIINQDHSYNGPPGGVPGAPPGYVTSPAPRGSIVSIYGTGGGQTNPPGIAGTVSPPIQALFLNNYGVTIGGQQAALDYGGAAPTLVAGVFQINAHVPTNITPGTSVAVIVTVNGVPSPNIVTMAVQ